MKNTCFDLVKKLKLWCQCYLTKKFFRFFVYCRFVQSKSKPDVLLTNQVNFRVCPSFRLKWKTSRWVKTRRDWNSVRLRVELNGARSLLNYFNWRRSGRCGAIDLVSLCDLLNAVKFGYNEELGTGHLYSLQLWFVITVFIYVLKWPIWL